MVAAWGALEAGQLPIPHFRLRFVAAASLFVPSALFALAWLQQLAAFAGGERSQALGDDPRLWWLTKALDLGIVIPAALGASIGLLQGKSFGIKLAYGFTGFLACLTAAVGGMGAVMLWTNDPSASPAMLVIALASPSILGAWQRNSFVPMRGGARITRRHRSHRRSYRCPSRSTSIRHYSYQKIRQDAVLHASRDNRRRLMWA